MRKGKSPSIFSYALRIVLPIGLVALFALWLLGSSIIQTILKDELEARISLSESAVAERVTGNLLRMQGIAKSLASNELFVNALVDFTGRSSYASVFIRSLKLPSSPSAEIFILDYKGRPIFSNNTATDIPLDLAEDPLAAMVRLDDKGVLLVEPIFLSGTPEGAVAIRFASADLVDLFGSTPENEHFMLTSENGVPVYTTGAGVFPENMSEARHLDYLNGWNISHRTLPEFMITLHYAVSEESIFAILNNVRLLLMGGLVLTLVVASGLIFATFYVIALPLKRLESDLRNAKKSDLLGQPVDISGPKEIAAVAIAYNQLRKQLRISTVSRNEAEKLAMELELQKKALDEHAIVSITNPAGEIIYANDKFCEISGYDKADLLGETYAILDSGYHRREFFKKIDATLFRREIWKGEICNCARDGTLFWVSTTIVPFCSKDGVLQQIISIRTDITKNKRLETKLLKEQELLEASKENLNQALTVFDENLVLVMTNSKVNKTLDLPEEIIQIGTRFEDIVRYNAERGEYGEGDIEELIATRVNLARNPKRHQFERETHDGRVLKISGNPMPTGGFVTTYADITEDKRLERELVEATEKAKAANRAKSDFLASMSHEIRTPMTAVMGFSDMLLEGDLSETAREKILKIKDATKSLLTIINDILDMSKLDAGKLVLENIDFNLPVLVNNVVSLFEEKLAAKPNLKIEVEISPDLPEDINSDPTRLRQILVNLLGNAVKFTSRGKIQIQLSMLSADANRKTDAIGVAVTDEGIGIAKDVLPDLFSEFTQADASTSRKFEGTGLGLAICKRLVEIAGGEIKAESKLGEGSRFSFSYPFNPASGKVEHAEIEEGKSDYETSRALDILVAEDNAVNQQIIEHFLSNSGHRVKIAHNGKEAFELAQKRPFDLILMDIRMPEMSGTEATKKIRAANGPCAKIPILAVTADAMEDHQREYFAVGMNGCITKPYEKKQIFHMINKVMEEKIYRQVSSGLASKQGSSNEIAPFRQKDLPAIGHEEKLKEFIKAYGAENFKEIIASAPDAVRAEIDKIEAGLAEGDSRIVRDAAHTLKGLSGSLYASLLNHQAAILQDKSDDLETVASRMTELHETAELTFNWWAEKSAEQ